MRAVFAPRARSDLAELLAYVDQQSPQTASAMAAAIDQSIARCIEQPRIGTETNRHNIYRMPLRKFGVTLFYRLRPRKREVEFIRIVRGSRVKSLGSVPRN